MKSALWILSSLILVSQWFAAGPVDYFEVILGKEEAKVGEALDITISAVDKNGKIVTDYMGDILVFSESDAQAEFPNDLAENSYSFTAVNEGSVKFENAVRFKNTGTQDVYVYDLNDENILWVAEVEITQEDTESNIDISILSPENGVTLGRNNITVSGTTRKNYQVRITVNDDQDIFTTSNEDGVFEKEVTDLIQGTNTFIAEILNADNEVIGTSERVDIKIDSQLPEFKRITITPIWEVQAESQISIEVVSNTGLSEVQAIINDIIIKLEEGKDGIYTAKTVAPKIPGDYPVDIVLKNEFANEVTEREVETITVIEAPELNAPDEPEEDEPVIETIENTTPVPEDLNLTITGIEVTELKTKSILTWDALEDAQSYNIYKKISENQIELIENVSEPRYEIEIVGEEIRYEDFAIKAIGKTASWTTVQWDLSDMTRVKTGPELYLIFALIAILMSSGIFFFRKNA